VKQGRQLNDITNRRWTFYSIL